MINSPAVYSTNPSLSDTVPVNCNFFYVSNAGASMETLAYKSIHPVAGGKLFAATIKVPAGATIGVWVKAIYFMSTGSGADIAVTACYNL